MFLAHMKLIIFSPTHIAVLFALVCKLSSLLCKGHFYYKLHEKLLIFVCYRETPGLRRPTSVTHGSDTGALPPIPGAEPSCIWTHRDTL